ncbi:MAG: DUF7507 domain-containing protein [Actinomycetota bacterium]
MRSRTHGARRRGSLLASLLGLGLGLALGQTGTLAARAAAPVDVPGAPSADGVQPLIADTGSSNDGCAELGLDHALPIADSGQISGGRRTMMYCRNDPPTEPDVTVDTANEPAGVVLAGNTITYILTVANGGNETATGVQVTDQLQTGVTFVDATVGCAESGGLVTCALGDIGPDAGLEVELTVTVDDGFCGSIVNSAHVSATNETGAATENNDAGDATSAVACDEPAEPDLRVTKSSDADGILREGDDVLYTITVTNVGDEPAVGVDLLDVLPPGALHVAVPPFPSFHADGCSVTSSALPGGVPHTAVRCGSASLASGASASVTVRVVVTGDVCGSITNVVDVAAANEPAANVGSDNHAEVDDEIACVPRIRVSKGGPTRAHVGDTVTYRFVAANAGGVDLSAIRLSDPTCDGPSILENDADGDDVLSVGEGWSYRCDHTIVAVDGDPVHSVATVIGDHDGGSVSDTDAHGVDVLHPNIALDETASPTSGTAGTTIVYRYTVTNTGDTTLFDISVDDDAVGHVGVIPSLAAGATAELTHRVTLGSSPITNLATAEGTDLLGASVSDEDVATVGVVAGSGEDGRGGTGGTAGGSPFTGASAGLMTGWIVALAAFGSSLLAVSRRRPRSGR